MCEKMRYFVEQASAHADQDSSLRRDLCVLFESASFITKLKDRGGIKKIKPTTNLSFFFLSFSRRRRFSAHKSNNLNIFAADGIYIHFRPAL